MTTLTTTHDTSHLPISFEGGPVPWVTRWTDEIQERSLSVRSESDGRLIATYNGADGIPDNRDARGVLWQREGVKRGGEPDWRSVNTLRQRTCITHRKCEVCGRKITSPVIRWLVPAHNLTMEYSDPLTTQAPTCDDCIPIALDLCPHLRRTKVVIGRVLEYDAFGVFGSIFTWDDDGKQPQLHDNMMYPYGSKAANPEAVMAKQLVARWKKYTLEEL